jgi:hypothetical protein
MNRYVVAILYAISTFSAAHAEGRFPGGGAFKGIAPPAPDATGRIGVQITPDTPEAPVVLPSGTDVGPTNTAMWFWSNVSPELANASSARLERSVAQLDKAPAGEVTEPRLQDLRDLADRYNTDILLATIGTNVSPALALSIMSVESGGRAAAESSAGAVGLMQLMPATAERFGVVARTNAGQNIDGGVKYLNFLMGEFDRDPIFVIAAYNAGEGAVRRAGGVPDYAETRAYVPKVLAAWKVARGLCVTPPELISDGCVFRLD